MSEYDFSGPTMRVYSCDLLKEESLLQLATEAVKGIDGGEWIISRSERFLYCVDASNTPVGILFVPPVLDGFLWVELVFVRPDFRRRGACTLLVRHVLALAAEIDAWVVAFQVHSGNEAMMKVSRSLGFKFELDEGPFQLASYRLRPCAESESGRPAPGPRATPEENSQTNNRTRRDTASELPQLDHHSPNAADSLHDVDDLLTTGLYQLGPSDESSS
jgi:GNAT superfamily N-acetyltransferase